MCCLGCKAASEWIQDAGFADFYRFRRQPSERPRTDDRWNAYTRPEVVERYVRREGTTLTAFILVDGLRCAACAWLIDKALRAIGVEEVQVNAATGQVMVEWRDDTALFAEILRRLDGIGFKPTVVGFQDSTAHFAVERRSALKQLAIAVFGMMQVMMFSVAQYSADLQHDTIDPALSNYFRLISLLVTTFVVAYSGSPFFKGALRSIRARTLGIDLSVSTAIVLAFSASVWNALDGRGEVYFDSVTMFVFFLTLARFISMTVRHRTVGVAEALSLHIPTIAHRLVEGRVEDVAANALQNGDVVLVRSGEALPADGVVIQGASNLDESLLTGESKPVSRGIGDKVIAGSINCGSPLQVKIVATREHTVIAHVADILRRAQAQRPIVAQYADRATSTFVRIVFTAAVVVGIGWMYADPTKTLSAVLAVLVAACPCAFSIAAPATFAAAAARLAKLGILVTRIDAIEKLAAVDTCIFDKTGTLTLGATGIRHVRVLTATHSEFDAMKIAAALELHSEHPIARAFSNVVTNLQARDVTVIPGRGLEGQIDGKRMRIGALGFAYELCPGSRVDLPPDGADSIVLSSEDGLIAAFYLGDELRSGSRQIAERLLTHRITSEIASGDSAGVVKDVARQCGIATSASRRLPADKLARIQFLQSEGRTVLAIGDGVNDAPVLGAANVSIAMGQGAALAHASADMILVSEDLTTVAAAIEVARSAVAVAKQNLIWSAIYNLTALPFAALGFLPPWIAAAGMSVSSTAVILNSMRLLPTANAGKPERRLQKTLSNTPLQAGTP